MDYAVERKNGENCVIEGLNEAFGWHKGMKIEFRRISIALKKPNIEMFSADRTQNS